MNWISSHLKCYFLNIFWFILWISILFATNTRAHYPQVLITKLRSANTVETRQYRKASKALLVLIPLLGITYLVLLYGPNEGVGNYIFVVARAFLLSTQVSNQFWIIQMAVTLISIRTENSEQRDGTKKSGQMADESGICIWQNNFTIFHINIVRLVAPVKLYRKMHLTKLWKA